MTKIGTWNLQNLFRPGGGSGSPGDEDAYRAKLGALARTISALDPDVLGDGACPRFGCGFSIR